MIDTLKLNDAGLPIARKKALKNIIERISRAKKLTKDELMKKLDKEEIAFISFLRFRFIK